MNHHKSKVGDVIIRMANREDCERIMELKRELAEHHGMQGLPMLSVEEFQRDGFDVDPPCYQCLLSEIPDPECDSKWIVVGYALYFYVYAAWEGKALFLEDLCVSKAARGKGVGSILMKQLAKIALEEKCARMQLEVSHFNDSGQKFYNSHGGWNTTQVEGWHNYRLDKEAIKRLVGQDN